MPRAGASRTALALHPRRHHLGRSMPTNSSAVAAIGLSALLSAAAVAPAQTRLLRYPDIHGDRVVFTYGGDLWTADVSGGDASRLTATPGIELFAKFSPDGRWIAFTGQVGGDEQSLDFRLYAPGLCKSRQVSDKSRQVGGEKSWDFRLFGAGLSECRQV